MMSGTRPEQLLSDGAGQCQGNRGVRLGDASASVHPLGRTPWLRTGIDRRGARNEEAGISRALWRQGRLQHPGIAENKLGVHRLVHISPFDSNAVGRPRSPRSGRCAGDRARSASRSSRTTCTAATRFVQAVGVGSIRTRLPSRACACLPSGIAAEPHRARFSTRMTPTR